MKLSKAQTAAVHHMDGPALCIAGPGSGKTAVIVNRTENLIKSGVEPKDILVVTFAKAAARSMEERFFSITGIPGVRFSTIHSVCYNIINRGRDFPYTLIPEKVKRSFLLKVSVGMKGDHHTGSDRQYRDLTMEISRFKSCIDEKGISRYNCSDVAGLRANSGKTCVDENSLPLCIGTESTGLKSNNEARGTVCDFLDVYDTHFMPKELFKKIYPAYAAFTEKNKYYDFDDMTCLAGLMLKKMPDNIKRLLQCRYLLIDEFQDTSFSQLCVLRKITAGDNIFAVGDDDQSVYSFRGASPLILRKFHSLYTNNKIYYLKENYRCNKIITSAANAVIRENKQRFSKEIISRHVSAGLPQGVEIKEFGTEHEEIKSVGEFLKSDMYAADRSFAVLTRTNHESELVCNMFKRAGIVFNSALKKKNPFDHYSTDSILSFIMFSLKRATLADFSNVFKILIPEIPNRALSACFKGDFESTMTNVYKYATGAGISWELNEAVLKLRLLKGMEPRMQVMFIRNACGLDDYFRRRYLKSGEDYEAFEERVDAFTEFAKEFSTPESMVDHLKCLESGTLLHESEELDPDCRVNVMTLHASKGLEFDIVWIINVNEGIIPFKKAVEKGMTEEERRLFYVGMTRARDMLILSLHRSFGNKRSERSTFLKELSSYY